MAPAAMAVVDVFVTKNTSQVSNVSDVRVLNRLTDQKPRCQG